MSRHLAISIVLYRPDPAVLLAFVDTLAAACRQLLTTTGVASHLHVIDNGDDGDPPACDRDALSRRLDGAVAGWRVLRGHGNVGYGAGHNLALAGEADFHLIANSDLLLQPDCLSAAVAYLDAHPAVGLLSPKVTNRDGGQEFTCKRDPSVFDLLLRGFGPGWARRLFAARLARYEMRDVLGDTPCHGVVLATGAFMLFRGALLRRLGGFDERFFLYFEDFDLSKRAAALAEIAYVPQVRVTHFGGHAARKGWAHRRMFIASMLRYFAKHGWKLW